MITEAEIRDKYKKLHDAISGDYYTGAGGLTKKEFDVQHGKIWDDMETELISGGFMTRPEPIRDLVAELDSLNARLKVLENKED